MEKQVNNICKSAMANLRNVADIRQSLTQEATKKLVHALVTSRLDSNNAMLYGLIYPGYCLTGSREFRTLQYVSSVVQMSPVLPI